MAGSPCCKSVRFIPAIVAAFPATCQQRDNTSQAAEVEIKGAPGLDDLIQQGAWRIIQQAIEAELAAMFEQYSNVKTIDGRRAVVRNGYLPEREIVTAVGPVPVQVPKVRDRSGSGIKFNSAIVPPYVRTSPRVSSSLPWLYLRGVSTSDMGEALSELLGEHAKGLSAGVVSRLKAVWADEYEQWKKRDLSSSRWVYWWADGIHTQARTEDPDGQCLLVIIGVKPDGEKERVALSDGYRESKESWVELLPDLKARRRCWPLAMARWGCGRRSRRCSRRFATSAAGFIKSETYSTPCPGRSTAVPRRRSEKSGMPRHAPTRSSRSTSSSTHTRPGIQRPSRSSPKIATGYSRSTTFLPNTWQHVRTTNPIESTFATVRHRTGRTRNCLSRATFLGMAFKLIEAAQQSWKKTRGADKIGPLLEGILFKDGTPVIESTPTPQALAA